MQSSTTLRSAVTLLSMRLKYIREKVILTCCVSKATDADKAVERRLMTAARLAPMTWKDAFERGYFLEHSALKISEATMGVLIPMEMCTDISIEELPNVKEVCQCKTLGLYKSRS